MAPKPKTIYKSKNQKPYIFITITTIIMAQRYLRQDLERTLIEHGVKDIGAWMNQAVDEKIQRAFSGGDSKEELVR